MKQKKKESWNERMDANLFPSIIVEFTGHPFDLIEQFEIGVDKNFELSINRCGK